MGRVLLYMPVIKTGEMRKLSLPNKGPYRIADISDTVFIVPEDKLKSRLKCVSWNCVRHCPEDMDLSHSEAPESEEDDNNWTRLRPRVKLLSVTRTSQHSQRRCRDKSLTSTPCEYGRGWI